MKKLRITLLLLMGIAGTELRGQAPIPTQFFLNPTLLNPAYVGATPNLRISSIVRYQWPAFTKVNTQWAATDYFIPIGSTSLGFGVGFNYYHDALGDTYLADRKQYRPQVAIEGLLSTKLAVRVGVDMSYIQSTYSGVLDAQTFENQLLGFPAPDPAVVNGGGISVDQSQRDIGLGFGLTTPDFWIGASTRRIQVQNNAVYNFTLNGGVEFKLPDRRYRDQIRKIRENKSLTFQQRWQERKRLSPNSPLSLRPEVLFVHQQGINTSASWLLFALGSRFIYHVEQPTATRTTTKAQISGGVWYRGNFDGQLSDVVRENPFNSFVLGNALSLTFGIDFQLPNQAIQGIGLFAAYDYYLGFSSVSSMASAFEVTAVLKPNITLESHIKCVPGFKLEERLKFSMFNH